MIILSLDELKVIDLIKILSEPKTKINFSKKRLKDIRKDFNKSRHMFSGSKIKQIRKNLYDIKNPRILSRSKINEIEKDLIELEESLSKLNKYYDYDNIEYKRIRDIENLFVEFDGDYYKPIKLKVLLMIITLNMKVEETRTKIYHLKYILILLDHT